MVPASISPRAAEIFQEGLRLPPKKLFRAGPVNQDLLDIILANCRIPEQNWGDLKALVARLSTGELHRLIGPWEPLAFDFGPARRQHERTWTPEVYDALIGLLMSLPAPYRPYVRRTLHARIQALAISRPVGPEDVRRLWRDLADSLRLGRATRPGP